VVRRRSTLLLASLIAALAFVGAALAADFFAGTLAVGASAQSGYDSAGARWRTVGAADKNPQVGGATVSRIAFIDSGGGWSCSALSSGNHSCTLTSPNYQKKGYCRNVGTQSFYVRCYVQT